MQCPLPVLILTRKQAPACPLWASPGLQPGGNYKPKEKLGMVAPLVRLSGRGHMWSPDGGRGAPAET
jgi:hypothetical protein